MLKAEQMQKNPHKREDARELLSLAFIMKKLFC